MRKYTLINMYNSSNYESWEQAQKLGGVYSTSLSCFEPSFVDEVSKAIRKACQMVDGNSKIILHHRNVSIDRTEQGWSVFVDGTVHSTWDDLHRAEIEAGWAWDELQDEENNHG